MNNHLTIKMGNGKHRRYRPKRVNLVALRVGLSPLRIFSKLEPLTSVTEAYKPFELRKAGRLNVELKPTI